MKNYSDSTVSRSINGLTGEQSAQFLNEWNASRDHCERIYISYDSTNKSSQAGDIDIVEYGHSKVKLQRDGFLLDMDHRAGIK